WQWRGLARPVAPEQCHDLAGVDRELEVADDRHALVAGVQPVDFDHGAHGVSLSPASAAWAASLARRASSPRYAAITSSLSRTSAGRPSAISRPNSRTYT